MTPGYPYCTLSNFSRLLRSLLSKDMRPKAIFDFRNSESTPPSQARYSKANARQPEHAGPQATDRGRNVPKGMGTDE
jgi:hypothetical protein